MKRLKLHVERIVRPIGANFRRKDEMREELLAHLSDVYEMKINEGMDNDAAIEGAIDAFGEIHAIRQQLQEAVPLSERALFFNLPAPNHPDSHFLARRIPQRENETTLAHAMRLTSYLGAFYFMFYFPLLGVNYYIQHARGHELSKFTFFALFGVALGCAFLWACFFMVLIGHRLQAMFDDWFWGRRRVAEMAAHCALSSLVVLAAGGVFWLISLPNLMPSWRDWMTLFVVATAVPIVLMILIRAGLAEFRRFGDWGSLEAEE